MQDNAATTNKLPDFNDSTAIRNMMWRMLIDPQFYATAAAFQPLRPYMAKLVNSVQAAPANKCSSCYSMKIYHRFRAAVDQFAKIFFYLHDKGRMDDLQPVRQYIEDTYNQPGFKFVFTYTGPCTSNTRREVVLEPVNE